MQDLSCGSSLRLPGQVLLGVNHPLLSQPLKELSILREFYQYPLHLRYHVGLIGKRNFETYFRINNVTRTSKVSDDRYSPAR